MTREIPLTQNKVVLVDDEDYGYLMQWKWHYGCHGYAIRSLPRNGNSRPSVLMHRDIIKCGINSLVDHINGDTLDNRKSNLRTSTKSQNGINRGMDRDNTSGYKGVIKKGNRWGSQIGKNKETIYLGRYATPEEAARAYDAKAKELFGEFANLNFKD